jgi:hypothetical protein
MIAGLRANVLNWALLNTKQKYHTLNHDVQSFATK